MDESQERGEDCWSHILNIRKEWGPVHKERRRWPCSGEDSAAVHGGKGQTGPEVGGCMRSRSKWKAFSQ